MGVGVSIFLFDRRKYQQELIPAYRSFVQKSDTEPLVGMLETAISLVNLASVKRSFLTESPAVYREYADILAGTVFYSSTGESASGPHQRTSDEDLQLFARRFAAPALLALYCVAPTQGFKPEQDLSQPGLAQHLYGHSRWIEDHLTFAKEPSGETPEITLGEWSRFFSQEEVRTFDRQLSQMPVPDDPEVADEFNNLRSLVHVSSVTEHLGLLMCIF